MPFPFRSRVRVPRHLGFLVYLVLSGLLFFEPLTHLVRLSLHAERYSYILAIPFVTAYLIYREKEKITAALDLNLGLGAILGACTVVFHGLANRPADPFEALSLQIFVMVSLWISAFLLFYRVRSVGEMLFPVGSLFLLIPIPPPVIDRVVLALQQGSAAVTFVLFKLAGVPVLRRAFTFSLPGFDIEVAPQCSGIRSSVAFILAGIVAGYLFLRSPWTRLSLGVLAIPVVIFKNAVRIFTISWLGLYVNPAFLHGTLHRYSGLPFSLIALAILFPLLFLLRKLEGRYKHRLL